MDNGKRKGVIMLIITSFLWSIAGILMGEMSWNGPQIAGFRSLVAALTILVYIKKPSFKFTKWRVCAILSYGLTVAQFAMANKLTTAANAILLQYTAPIYSAVLGAILLKERVRVRDVVSIAVILAGMVLFLFDGLSSGNMLGNLMALGCGLCFGCTSVFTRLERDNDPAQSVFWGNLLCFGLMVPLMGGAPELSAVNVGCILALGVFQLGIAYIIYTKAVRYVSALEVTVLTVLEPILNPVWVFVFQGQIPGALALIGGAVIILGVVGREAAGRLLDKHFPESASAQTAKALPHKS